MMDLLIARSKVLSQAGWTKREATYVRANNIPIEAVNAYAGLLTVIGCCFYDNGRFALEGDMLEWAVVIEIYGEDDESVIDLCAWPYERPESFATFLGSDALGLARTVNPATWAFGGFLRVYRTPLRWLQANCQGCVVMDHRHVPAWLGRVAGAIQAEEIAHARQLEAWLNPPRFDRRRILVPRVERWAA